MKILAFAWTEPLILGRRARARGARKNHRASPWDLRYLRKTPSVDIGVQIRSYEGLVHGQRVTVRVFQGASSADGGITAQPRASW